jgi:hypothetical protein
MDRRVEETQKEALSFLKAIADFLLQYKFEILSNTDSSGRAVKTTKEYRISKRA